jgi:hypothetical protein
MAVNIVINTNFIEHQMPGGMGKMMVVALIAGAAVLESACAFMPAAMMPLRGPKQIYAAQKVSERVKDPARVA